MDHHSVKKSLGVIGTGKYTIPPDNICNVKAREKVNCSGDPNLTQQVKINGWNST